MIKVMKYVFIIIFAVSLGVHLYASLKQDKRIRNYSKPFLLLALLGWYCLSADRIALTVVLALVFSWLGDVLLMPKGVKWFTAGGISFMVSHFFFVLSYAQYVDFTKIALPVIILLALFFIITVTIIFHHLREHLPKALFYPMYLYLLINGTMNCFAFFRYLSNSTAGGLITVIGAVLFFISDASLFFVRFHKNSALKTHFLVMLTYSIGEFLIVLGLLLK